MGASAAERPVKLTIPANRAGGLKRRCSEMTAVQTIETEELRWVTSTSRTSALAEMPR